MQFLRMRTQALWRQRPGPCCDSAPGFLHTSGHQALWGTGGWFHVCLDSWGKLSGGLGILSLKCHRNQIRLTHAQFGGPPLESEDGWTDPGLTSLQIHQQNPGVRDVWMAFDWFFLGFNRVHSNPRPIPGPPSLAFVILSPAWVPPFLSVPSSGRSWYKNHFLPTM